MQVLRVEITVVHGETMLPILLRSVQLLFSRVSSTPTGRTHCFTRMLNWNAQKIVQVRCHRWDIEPLHEQIKQFLGAEDSQLQTEAGVRRHLTLVFVVNSLLKSLDRSQPIGDLPMTEFQDVLPTFGQRCRRILLEVFHDLIQTIAQWLKENQMTPSQVFELLFNRLLYV